MTDIIVEAIPLKLLSGAVVLPTGEVQRPHRSRFAARERVATVLPTATKKLTDLPAAPEQLNTIGVVLVYSLYGLGVEDIAHVTRLTVAHIISIREHEAYTRLQEELIKSLTQAVDGDVRFRLHSEVNTAVTKLIELVDDDDPKIALGAAKDILDRTGHRPNDVVEHKHTMENSLRIEVVRRDDSAKVPMIDITPNILTGEL